MGFLESIKGSLMGASKNENDSQRIQHPEDPSSSRDKKSGRKGGFLSSLLGGLDGKKTADSPKKESAQSSTDDGELTSLNMFDDYGMNDQDDDYNMINDEIKSTRPDILEILDIAANYPVPNNVLLVGDLDRVRFDITRPEGYDIKMVEEFFDSVHDSISWYVDRLQQRNNDIRKMEDMLNKQETDIHNMQTAEALSDPDMAVLTGAESTTAQELQAAQLTIITLKDENAKLKEKLKRLTDDGASSSMDAETQSRYDELQNQLALCQIENKKLKSQLKRQAREEAIEFEDDLDLDDMNHNDVQDDGSPFDDGPEDSSGMPGPDMSNGGMPGPASRRTTPNTSMGMPMPGARKTHADEDGAAMPQANTGGMPGPAASKPKQNAGGMPGPSFDNRPVGASLNGYGNRTGENKPFKSLADAMAAEDEADEVFKPAGEPIPSPFDRGRRDRDDSGDRPSFTAPTGPADEIPLPTTMDDGDFDEFDLFDEDEDGNGIINMEDFD